MEFFKYFPEIDYNGLLATNITLRGKVRDVIQANIYAYYPYTVRDEDKPEIISHKYYGSVAYTWLIFLANDILDPHHDWPLTYNEFIDHIIKKYGSVEVAQTTTKYYYNQNKFIIDETTFHTTPEQERSSISVYDWENELNEAKRNIKIIDGKYLSQILNEIRHLFD